MFQMYLNRYIKSILCFEFVSIYAFAPMATLDVQALIAAYFFAFHGPVVLPTLVGSAALGRLVWQVAICLQPRKGNASNADTYAR
jgi:hypothetical protein